VCVCVSVVVNFSIKKSIKRTAHVAHTSERRARARWADHLAHVDQSMDDMRRASAIAMGGHRVDIRSNWAAFGQPNGKRGVVQAPH